MVILTKLRILIKGQFILKPTWHQEGVQTYLEKKNILD